MLTGRYGVACSEGVASVARDTGAGGQVVDDAATRIHPAHARTRVHAVQVLACFGARTVGIYGAFRPACHVGVAKILGDATACCCPLSFCANGILSARGWVARVYNFGWCYS